MMDMYAFLALGLGLVFILLEVFFPSFGILGTLAAVSIALGGWLAWRSDSGIFGTYLVAAFVLAPVVGVFALKVFPRTPMGRALTLSGPTFDLAEARPGGRELETLVDQVGVTLTALRPAGKALVGERRVDVLTRGELLERGTRIKVVRVEGNRVFVAEHRV